MGPPLEAGPLSYTEKVRRIKSVRYIMHNMQKNIELIKEHIVQLQAGGIFTGDIDTNTETLETHSRDSSVFKVTPEVVIFPKNIADIQAVLSFIYTKTKEGMEPVSVSVRAGGTCMSGGSLNPGIVFNMTRYMKDVVYDTALKRATVDMGAMFKVVADTASYDNTIFGGYPSSKDICGIAGMIGNNASGEKSVRFGATIDNVLGLEVVLADGSVIHTGVLETSSELTDQKAKQDTYKIKIQAIRASLGDKLKQAIGRVPKTASGYRLERIMDEGPVDLTPLFVGAQGTLGIITKAVLKFVPAPESTRLLVISVDELSRLPFVLKTIMTLNPEGVETFDVHTFEKAKNFLKKEVAMCQKFFNEETNLVVLAQFAEETPELTDSVAKKCQDELHKCACDLQTAASPKKAFFVEYIDNQEVADSIWKIRRSSFTAMQDWNPEGMHAVPCIEDIIVPIDRFGTFVPALVKLLRKYNLEYGFHGHIGDGSLRIIPIFDFKTSKKELAAKIINFTREAIALVKSLEGNMSADHSDGIIRSPFIREFYGEDVYKAFVDIKELFDPLYILNKGKKVGGLEESIEKYLID